MKKYLKASIAMMAALAILGFAPVSMAADAAQMKADAKEKIAAVHAKIAQKICELKCKKDADCKAKCGEKSCEDSEAAPAE
jgi:curli biogenesis system outer membrane secretion channel CsgG